MIALLNPNLVLQRNDPFTTGIVYMPVGLAYVAATLRKAGFPCQVLDAFGEAPRQAMLRDRFMMLGLRSDEVVQRMSPETRAAFVYAGQLTHHVALCELIHTIRRRRPEVPVVILENTQAVTAYSLRHVSQELFAAGAEYLLYGEPEQRAVTLAGALVNGREKEILNQIPGLRGKNFDTGSPPVLENPDELPFPAWDLFPLENYWSLRFAHGPLYGKRYLPLLTSRGCPFACRFCVVPETNHRRWRPRSAENVVDEMEHWHKTFSVREFHWEDLNPTVNEERIREICREILQRRLNVRWVLAAGTKAETLKDPDIIALMAQAGCRYISMSPESGSDRVLERMNKQVNISHMLALIRESRRHGIFTQVCFVLGFPGETPDDRRLTRRRVAELTRAGADEIALFIITPVPGSAIYAELQGYRSLSELNFTPTWRPDYRELNRFRLQIYGLFLLLKLLYYPLRFWRQPINFLRRRFETKMEMVPYRACVWKYLEWKARGQKQ